jgi:hypothetical protein
VGEECLWTMIDLLRPESLIEVLNLKFPLVLNQIRELLYYSQSHPISSADQMDIFVASSTSTSLLSTRLKHFDAQSRSSIFSSASFTCGICLMDRKGHRCIRLSSCDDVFCSNCLISYFTLLIREGLVRSVHCASVRCMKERVTWGKQARKKDERGPGHVSGEELEGIVGKELRERYDKLLEKMRVESGQFSIDSVPLGLFTSTELYFSQL